MAALKKRVENLFKTIIENEKREINKNNKKTSKKMLGDNKLPENPLAISWHDSAWIPILSPHNVMDYFSERSNPFYDRHCNNEQIKMQRKSLEQLSHMQGVEFALLHVQEPILYVIRKQHRFTQTQVMIGGCQCQG